MLLSVSDQGPAVDLVADTLLHHLPSVELEARVCGVYAPGGKLRGCDEADAQSDGR